MNPVVVNVSLQSNNEVYTVGFNEAIVVTGGGDYPWYEGDYNVTPKPVAQTLNTEHTSMKYDVEVEAIPYSEVSNPQGGLTINIAFD